MAASRLPGGPPGGLPGAGRLIPPRLAGSLLAASALLLSALQIPAANRVSTESAQPDSVVIQVEPAFRSEFDPIRGGAAVRRSRVYRIHLSVWSIAPPNQLMLVVGSEPDDPTTLGPLLRAQAASGGSQPAAEGSPIRAPRRSPGDPACQDASGWSAWNVTMMPKAPELIDTEARRIGNIDRRHPVHGGISVDSATVASLGPWIGLFDDRGQRLATGHLRQVTR